MINALRFPVTADNMTGSVFAQVRGELGKVKGMLATVQDRAQRVGRSMRNIGLGATAGITAPVLLAGRQMLTAYDQQAKAEATVAQAILSTGGAANRTLDDLLGLAGGLQRVTTFGDENILQNVTAPLLTFTKIQGETFDRAQTNVLDMATLLRMDLKSASVLVGKALNDPIKGISALGRSGVQFSDDQKAVIKALVETGDVAAAQGLILQELETQFGGQAAAAARVGTGALTQLKNAIGDVQEQLGAEIVGFLPPLLAKVQSAVDWFSQLSPEVKANIVLFGGLAAAVGPIVSGLGLTVLGVTQVAAAFKALGVVLLANPILAVIAAVAAGAYAIYRNWDSIGPWFQNLWGNIRTGAEIGWGQIKSTIETYSPEWLKSAWRTVAPFFDSQWRLISVGFSMAWSEIKANAALEYGADSVLLNLWHGVPGAFGNIMRQVGFQLHLGWVDIKLMIGQWVEDFTQLGRDIVAGLRAGIEEKWGELRAWFEGTMIGGLISGAKAKLRSRSPSRVFMGIGEDIMDGLGIGLRNNANVPSDALAGAVEGLKGQVGAQSGATSWFQSLAQGANQAFQQIITGSQSVGEALRSWIGGALSSLGSQFLSSGFNSIAGFLLPGLFPNAKGNVFSGGRVTPFARGGIVSSPTLFPMRGGNTGLMGEAGPEAILPLARGAGGRLGVQAQGGRQEVVVRVEHGDFMIGDNGEVMARVRVVAEGTTSAGLQAYDQRLPGRVHGLIRNNDTRKIS
ncbi:MAG: hypothetical protein AAFN94_00850 [Pseudomonadota bacterium]